MAVQDITEAGNHESLRLNRDYYLIDFFLFSKVWLFVLYYIISTPNDIYTIFQFQENAASVENAPFLLSSMREVVLIISAFCDIHMGHFTIV